MQHPEFKPQPLPLADYFLCGAVGLVLGFSLAIVAIHPLLSAGVVQ